MVEESPASTALVFVYNADAGVFNALGDLAHKMLSPETYSCNLCAITYAPLGMRKRWKRFLESLPVAVRFLHRNELPEQAAIAGAPLPAVFLDRGGFLAPWIGAEELNACENLDDLERLIRARLESVAPRTLRRPSDSEYAPFYRGYVERVPEGDIVETLVSQGTRTLETLAGVPPEREVYRYAPDKWSLVEVVGHLVDTEWIFVYRALRFARGDTTPLPGVDQDVLVSGAGFDRRPLASLIREFNHLRRASTELFRGFDDRILDRSGEASGALVTVRALLYIIAGHHMHHMDVLEERYLRISEDFDGD